MSKEAKIDATIDLATYVAEEMYDLVELDLEDVLGMAVISIANVLQHKRGDREDFRQALVEAHSDFLRCTEYKTEVQKTNDPLSALVRVIARNLPKDSSQERVRKIKLPQDLKGLLDDVPTHSDCEACKDSKLKITRTASWFRQQVGRDPTKQELLQVNCGCAGEPRHSTCGVCETCDMPFMMCKCVG